MIGAGVVLLVVGALLVLLGGLPTAVTAGILGMGGFLLLVGLIRQGGRAADAVWVILGLAVVMGLWIWLGE